MLSEPLALKVSKDLLVSLVSPDKRVLQVPVGQLALLARPVKMVTLENLEDLAREESLGHRVLVVSLGLLDFLASKAFEDTTVWMD
ncbi:hypothetical protein OFB94_26455 [Escherichia coli]|nr:hypothetical protein [Escherichia coli]MCV4683248.1 hypothetical protein [Escherichia coli]